MLIKEMKNYTCKEYVKEKMIENKDIQKTEKEL